jgi:uncharacterized protein (UPF0332 family)
MSLADDLLDTAKYLLRQNNNKPSDAAIRRSISTAYYALFHRLIEAATGHLVADANQQVTLARTFAHTTMKRVCEAVRDDKLPFLGSTVPAELKQLATTFAELQEQRHDADYSRSRTFTKADARGFVKRVEEAVGLWRSVQTTPIAGPFLLLLLLGEPKAR